MPLKSDLVIDASKFDVKCQDKHTNEFNEKLIRIGKDGPRWYEVGAAEYRKLRWEGKTPLPKPVLLSEGLNGELPSREAGRRISYRVFKPANATSRGIFLHIHGGGWVLQSEHSQDPYLKYMAGAYELTVLSVGYRLAPEDPWPACIDDCCDAATWLIENGKEKFGGDLLFMGGESAGAHLACLVAFNLRDTFTFKGFLLHFGCYDLSAFFPMVEHHTRHLVIDHQIMSAYIDALLPNTSAQDRRHPSISPFFADIRGWSLPPALFTCGTEDPLLDDTVFMGTKWAMWGNESVVKIYRNAPHGFIMYPLGSIKATEEGLKDSVMFVKEKMGVQVG